MKKAVALLLFFVTVLLLAVPAMASEGKSEDIVILYTNDVHTNVNKPLGYDVIGALKDELLTRYHDVLLVDAGDHIQGTAYGAMDNGETIVELMNAAGYDAATMGNHEFDYGFDGFEQVLKWADFSYLSCNFYETATGETVVEGYKVFDCGDRAVAIVGITTPDTGRVYFRDENGNDIYSIDNEAEKMYAQIQNAIDASGADTVIALGHLGTENDMAPWRSTDVIANTDGLHAFIDGHSHYVMEQELVKNKNGESVILTQTGSFFDRIGMMVINAETGEITTDFIEIEEVLEQEKDDQGNPVFDEDGEPEMEVVDYTFVNGPWAGDSVDSHRKATVKAINDGLLAEVQEKLGIVVGTFTENVVMRGWGPYGEYDNAPLPRLHETNAGDFCSDALYYLFDSMELDVDVAVTNAGGILGKQEKPITGEIDYIDCRDIHPYGNVACLLTVTGRQILDALEWGSRLLPKEAKGSFLQVAGLTCKLDTSIENTTQKDAQNIWCGSPTGDYRVYDVEIYNKETNAYEPLDLEKEYNLAGYNYILRNRGDGFGMFADAVNVVDYVMEDYMILANYIEAFENSVVDAVNSPLLEKYSGMLLDYSKPDGAGRIVMEEKPESEDEIYVVCWGDTLGKIAKRYGCTVQKLVESNRDLVKNPNLILVGWELTIPKN